jgi:solute carrier family 35 protein F1/2
MTKEQCESVANANASENIINLYCGKYGPIFHGQVISCLISCTGFFASLLASNGANFPMLQSFLTYLLLSTYLGRIMWANYKSNTNILTINLEWPLWLYILVAILDVEANVLVISAYRYTSITSIMLLDCFSIPCVMLLSMYFLHARYTTTHIIGVCICLGGMGCIILSDVYVSSNEKVENAWLGDIFCLVSHFICYILYIYIHI